MQTKHVFPIVALIQAVLIAAGAFHLLDLRSERDWLRQEYLAAQGLAETRAEEVAALSTVAGRYEAEIQSLKRNHLRAQLTLYIQSVNGEAPAEEIAEAVLVAAEETGIEASWLIAKLKQESYFNPNAVSRTGCRGLAQMCRRASQDVGLAWDDAFDPYANVLAGARYLKRQLDRTGGDMAAALTRYNGNDDPRFVSRIERHRARFMQVAG